MKKVTPKSSKKKLIYKTKRLARIIGIVPSNYHPILPLVHPYFVQSIKQTLKTPKVTLYKSKLIVHY